MNNSNNTPKPRFLVAADKKQRLSVLIPKKLSDQIADYQVFHEKVAGEKATLDSLVSAFISAALTSDKSFLAWKKEQARKSTTAENDSTETQNSEAKNASTITQNSEADSVENRNYYMAEELTGTRTPPAGNSLLDIMTSS